jgi:parallel beta-helix repeat protein
VGTFIHGDSVANRIEGNFIGTDPTGTIGLLNRGDGVSIVDGPSETVVGGTTPAARNVISGNPGVGIFVDSSNESRIQGNYVGTDKSGTNDLGNVEGIFIGDASGTTVGGKTAAARNVISGNNTDGLSISNSQGIKVLGNRIGTTASGTGALGNALKGVDFRVGTSNNLLGDGTSAGSNTIAFNGIDGVDVGASSTGNEISRNSIFSNTGLGIDLIGPGENPNTSVSTPTTLATLTHLRTTSRTSQPSPRPRQEAARPPSSASSTVPPTRPTPSSSTQTRLTLTRARSSSERRA